MILLWRCMTMRREGTMGGMQLFVVNHDAHRTSSLAVTSYSSSLEGPRRYTW